MTEIPWHKVFEIVQPHIVRIITPDGSGSGFLVSHSQNSNFCAVATAAHVVSRAHYWEQPIRLVHADSGKSIMLHHHERGIYPDEKKDTAAILFDKGELSLPKQPLDLAPEGKWLKIGNEIGWLGFPAISPKNLCFFSGRISQIIVDEHAYLVDGVVINGVSGGPSLFNGENKVVLMGVVSAYIANRATGETLPGLSVVRGVAQMQAMAKVFKSVDEAKKEEPQPLSPPPPQAGTEQST